MLSTFLKLASVILMGHICHQRIKWCALQLMLGRLTLCRSAFKCSKRVKKGVKVLASLNTLVEKPLLEE